MKKRKEKELPPIREVECVPCRAEAYGLYRREDGTVERGYQLECAFVDVIDPERAEPYYRDPETGILTSAMIPEGYIGSMVNGKYYPTIGECERMRKELAKYDRAGN